jgi:hypothetical protein
MGNVGGRTAAITADESAKGITDLLDKLELEDRGKFFSYNGETLPW